MHTSMHMQHTASSSCAHTPVLGCLQQDCSMITACEIEHISVWPRYTRYANIYTAAGMTKRANFTHSNLGLRKVELSL